MYRRDAAELDVAREQLVGYSARLLADGLAVGSAGNLSVLSAAELDEVSGEAKRRRYGTRRSGAHQYSGPGRDGAHQDAGAER